MFCKKWTTRGQAGDGAIGVESEENIIKAIVPSLAPFECVSELGFVMMVRGVGLAGDGVLLFVGDSCVVGEVSGDGIPVGEVFGWLVI